MNRKIIISLVVATILSSSAQHIYVNPVAYAAEDVDTDKEYTSKLNPVKPSEAPDDYVVKFKNGESKEFIMKGLRITNKKVTDDITVSDMNGLYSLSFNADFTEVDKMDISFEGLQYAKKLRTLNVKHGVNDINWINNLFKPVNDENIVNLSLMDFGFTEIPKYEGFKNVTRLTLSNNNIESLECKGLDNITNLIMSNNNIKNLKGLENFPKITRITMDNNQIDNIDDLLIYKDQITSISFANNKIGNETFKKAFSEEYINNTNSSTAVFSYNQITDTQSILNFKSSTFNSHLGKQGVFKIIDTDEFDFSLKSQSKLIYDEERKREDFIDGLFDIQLDETDLLESLDNDKYRLVNKDDLVTTVYWNKRYYDVNGYNPEDTNHKNARYFSGALNIINIAPLINSLENAKNDLTDESIEAANEKYNDMAIISEAISYEELNKKLNEVKKEIDSLNNLKNEYTSIYNNVAPSIAKDDQEVKFVDNKLAGLIKYTLKKEPEDNITVGDMRSLTELIKILPRNAEDVTPDYFDRFPYTEDIKVLQKYGLEDFNKRITSLEGLQYATNLKHIEIGVDGSLLWNKLEERDELLKSPEKLPEFKYTGFLKPISNLSSIEYLGLGGYGITSKDILDLKNIEIKKLNLIEAMIDDLSPFSDMTSLEELYLLGNIVKSTSGIENLKNLVRLELGNNALGLGDTSALANLTNLKFLNLRGNMPWEDSFEKALDISSLENLKQLEELYVNANGIKDITPLKNLTSLQKLGIASNRITDVSALKDINRRMEKLDSTSQVIPIVLEDGSYKFSIDAKDFNGERIDISRRPFDLEISKLSDTEFELRNKNVIRTIKSWSVPNGFKENYTGDIVILNKNKVEELVQKAKDDPTQKNIDQALSALELMEQLPTQKNYVEEHKAILELLSSKVEAREIILDKNEISLEIGSKEKLTATVSPEDATNKEVEWTSSDDTIAKVGQGGNVQGIAKGTATITATVKGTDIKATAQVTVTEKETPVVPEKPTAPTLPDPGANSNLSGFVLDTEGSTIKNGDVDVPTNSYLMFKFTNGVSRSNVLPKNTDKLSIYDKDGNKLDATVKAVPDAAETPSEYADRAAFEDAYRRFLTLNVKEGLKPDSTYTVVISPGVEANNGSKTADEYKIKFTTASTSTETPEEVKAESVSLNKSKLNLKEGQKEKLTATVSPSNAVNKDIEWSSSNANIAKVDAQGNVEAVAEGKATIRATVKGTDISAKAEVTVTKDTVVEPETDIKATSVRLNASSAELKKDDTYQLRATVNPTNSTQKDIEWTSTNSSVVTVDGNGLVKAVGEGTATIRARVKGTEVSVAATVTVKADEKPVKAESIELDASKVDMQVEQKEKLVATVKPDKAENKEVEWSSSDENVVKVDSEGNLEAVGAGTAKVTAKVKGTDITAEAEIVVTERAKPIDTTTKFTDINNHWAKAFIEHAFARGLFKGTTETLFSPETNMTRGMFVTVLGRLAGETAEPNDKFSDVDSEAYYAEYIAWAEENGIVEGYGNGKFGPDNNVTREEMAAIIQRYMDYKGIELEDNDTEEFRDAGDISDWAKESVTKIQKAGIIEGKGNGVFDPQANSTRAEVATLLIRMIEKYID